MNYKDYTTHNIKEYTMTSQQTYPQNGPNNQYQNPEKNGFGIAALILGIIGLLFCLMPITGFIGFSLGVMALIFGLAGYSRVKKNKATNKKTAIFGTITGTLAIVFGIIGIVMFFSAVEELGTGLDCISNADTIEQMDAC